MKLIFLFNGNKESKIDILINNEALLLSVRVRRNTGDTLIVTCGCSGAIYCHRNTTLPIIFRDWSRQLQWVRFIPCLESRRVLYPLTPRTKLIVISYKFLYILINFFSSTSQFNSFLALWVLFFNILYFSILFNIFLILFAIVLDSIL